MKNIQKIKSLLILTALVSIAQECGKGDRGGPSQDPDYTHDSPTNAWVSTSGGGSNDQSRGFPTFFWCASRGNTIPTGNSTTAGQILSAPGCSNQAYAVCNAINQKYTYGEYQNGVLDCYFKRGT